MNRRLNYGVILMLERKIINNPAYKYVGVDETTGNNMYIVPIRENKKVKEEVQLDDGLFYDDSLPEEYYSDLDMPDVKEIDYNNLTKKDFYKMDYKEICYVLYRQINIFISLLSDKQEVCKDGK